MIGRLFFHFVEDVIRNVSGPIGLHLRRFYYKRRLGGAGYGLIIDIGVSFQSPKNIYLGDHVWIDKNVIFIAGTIQSDSDKITHKQSSGKSEQGKIRFGSYCHIGIGTVVQGHGGFFAGDYFTSSAGCRIYSFSNDYGKSKSGTVPMVNTMPDYIMGAVVFGRNVWIGLGVSVISAVIGDDAFILPHSVVYHSIANNVVAGGNPAIEIRSRFSK